MKICPACKESNHDAADVCLLCEAALPDLPEQSADPTDEGDKLVPSGPQKPKAGSLALALYHDVDPRILHYFVLGADITTLGREDARCGVFPAFDLGPFAEQGVAIQHVSRQHLRLFKRDTVEAEVLPGTTGTQINKAWVAPGTKAVLHIGDRIILGAKVRLKLLRL